MNRRDIGAGGVDVFASGPPRPMLAGAGRVPRATCLSGDRRLQNPAGGPTRSEARSRRRPPVIGRFSQAGRPACARSPARVVRFSLTPPKSVGATSGRRRRAVTDEVVPIKPTVIGTLLAL